MGTTPESEDKMSKEIIPPTWEGDPVVGYDSYQKTGKWSNDRVSTALEQIEIAVTGLTPEEIRQIKQEVRFAELFETLSDDEVDEWAKIIGTVH